MNHNRRISSVMKNVRDIQFRVQDKHNRFGFFVCCLMLHISLLLTACGGDGTSDNDVISGEGTVSGISQEQEGACVPEESGNSIAGEIQKLFLDDFSGYICYAGNETIMCLGHGVMLVNCRNMEVLNEIPGENAVVSFYDFLDCEVYMREEGYTVIGTFCDARDSDTRLIMVEFDRELGDVKVIDAEEWAGAERGIMAYQLLDNGSKILYTTMEAFYLYDSGSKETTVLDTGDVFVLDFALIEGSNQILFAGNDLNSERVLGRMDLSDNASAGTEIFESKLWGKIWAYAGGALIEEADVYGKEKAGRIFSYNAQDGIRQYPLTGTGESGAISISSDGGYYATKTFVQGEGYFLRLYSSEDGRLVREYLLTYDEYGEEFRLNNILICEDVNKIILMANGVQDQKEGTWLMSMDL